MAEEQDFASLPLKDRLTHKVWKARLSAYEEYASQFQKSPSEEAECFNVFNSQPELVKKIITDSNVVSQEAGIQMLLSFLEYGGSLNNVTRLKNSGIVSSLCEKGLSSSRPGTKSKSIEALLFIVEILNTADGVIEELLPFFKHRLPKLVAGCVAALTSIVENFGCGDVVSPSILFPEVPKLFTHSDKNVRGEATKLAIELYKWMGASLETILFQDLKPIQQKELSKHFSEIEVGSQQPKRLTRKQREQAEMRKREEEITALQDQDVEMVDLQTNTDSGPKAIDAFDILPATEVLSRMPSDMDSRLNSSKWKERKDVLEEIHSILEKAMKLTTNDDYSNIIRIFAKCMKDANLQVVQLAANCATLIARGLRKEFGKYQHIMLRPVIERTKEKKASVVEALNNLLDALFASSSLSELLNDILWGMKHKTPQVKIASTSFLKNCLEKTEIAPTAGEVEQIMDVGVKLLAESQEPIRQAATEMIGVLMKITGERYLSSSLEKLDNNRRSKILDCYNSATARVTMGSTATVPREERPSDKKVSATTSLNSNTRPASRTSFSTSSKMKNSLFSSSNPQLSHSKTDGNSTIPSKRGATSPAKRVEDTSKVSTFGRGLTSRSLISNSKVSVSTSLSHAKADLEMAQADREELRFLKKEKEIWKDSREQVKRLQEQLDADTLKHNKEISNLNSQIERLQKEQTNSALMIKQKETQLLRSNGDLENAKLKIRDLEQTIEMMKLQQNSYVNQQHAQLSRLNYDGLFSSTTSPYRTETRLKPVELSPPKQIRLTSGELSSRVNRLSIDGELQNENVETPKQSRSLSRYASPQKMVETTNTFSSSFTKPVADIHGEDDSWRRAAEVTSQLKARIEKMKARSRSGMSNFT